VSASPDRSGGRPVRRAVAWATAASIACAHLAGIAVPARAQSPGGVQAAMTRAEYEACQTGDEAAFRSAIEAITLKALQHGLDGIDYRAIVSDEWRRGNFDDVMARRVDAVIAEIRSESSWTQLLESLAFKESAQTLATMAAERVYRSDEIKKAIENLALGVGRSIGRRIEFATGDAAEPATQCLQAFLGPRYGATIAGVVARDAGKEFAIDPAKGSAQVTTGQVLSESTDGIAGAVVLIVRRQLANMATRVGQRLLGAALGRIVSVVAGGLGVVLIAKDVWELRYGVLPIIAEEMKSPATRTKVQDELAKSIGEQINEHVREIAAKTADRIVEIWRDFRRAHAKVLEIADRTPKFKAFIDTVKPQNLARLDEVVGLVLAAEGEGAILKRLDDGTLHEAVERLPQPAFEIARETRSLSQAFAWTALAGDQLPRVTELELFRRNRPEQFTKVSLQRILALDDGVAIARLASLPGTVREPLLEVGDPDLKRLARTLDETELTSLSSYLTRLERNASQRLLSAVAHAPVRMRTIAAPTVRNAILASRDQAAAVDIMLRADGIFDFVDFAQDMTSVKEGRVNPWILWARYPVALSLSSVLTLIVLLVLWRVIFGRRRRVA
jgi:hypothetical protein